MSDASLLSLLKQNKQSGNCDIVATYVLLDPFKENATWKCCVSEGITPDETQFKCLEDLVLELEIPPPDKPQINGSRKRRHNSDTISKTPDFASLKEALKKSLESKLLWSKDSLVMLIQSGFITHGLLDLVLENLFKYEAMDVLLSMGKLQLTPQHFIQVLRHLLSDTSPANLDHSLINNLSYVVSLPFDKVAMRNHLKLLTSGQAVTLMKVLQHAVDMCSPALVGADLNVFPYLTEKKLLDWIDSLLCSHILTFTMSPTLKPIVIGLRKTLSKQKHFYADIATLAPYLAFLKKHKRPFKLPKRTIGRYSMESITI